MYYIDCLTLKLYASVQRAFGYDTVIIKIGI